MASGRCMWRPKGSPPFNPREVKVFGRTFPSRSAAARAYNQTPGRVASRLKAGWTLEEALLVPLIRS